MTEVIDNTELWESRELGVAEEYVEVVEVNIEPAIEGDVVLAQQGEKLFKSVIACADYVSIFGIKDYVIRDGRT